MESTAITTKKGITGEVRTLGQGAPLVFLHGAGGLMPKEPLLELLAQRYKVYAPVWPGYGEQQSEELIEDMLDFALHGWDIIEELGLERPNLVGHSMGGMIAAEMAALNPRGVNNLVLIDSAGLWLDEHPIPDIFATLPFHLGDLLFHDPAKGEEILTGGGNFRDRGALGTFMVANARRLGTAGKILFPIPNRRLSKRLYRMSTPTLLVWGKQDKLVPAPYAERFQELIPHAQLELIDQAGHMAPYEQPEAVERAITAFLG